MDIIVRLLAGIGLMAVIVLGFCLFTSFGLIAVIVVGMLFLWNKIRGTNRGPSFRIFAFPGDASRRRDDTQDIDNVIDVDFRDVTGRKH